MNLKKRSWWSGWKMCLKMFKTSCQLPGQLKDLLFLWCFTAWWFPGAVFVARLDRVDRAPQFGAGAWPVGTWPWGPWWGAGGMTRWPGEAKQTNSTQHMGSLKMSLKMWFLFHHELGHWLPMIFWDIISWVHGIQQTSMDCWFFEPLGSWSQRILGPGRTARPLHIRPGLLQSKVDILLLEGLSWQTLIG